MAGVLVFAEQRDGKLRKPGLEAVSEGRRIADKLSADLTVLLASERAAAGQADVARLGADRILSVDDARLALYAPGAYTRAAVEAVRNADPDLFLMAASALGKDLSARVAARLKTGLAADCTAINVESGVISVKRPVYSGKAVATMTFAASRPAMVTLQIGRAHV